jgi:uncharacterized protein (DUF58 family)
MKAITPASPLFPIQVADWLETHWVTPAYSGWVLLLLSLFFFAAATNTMAGWLYVMSGFGLALLILSAVLTVRSLRGIEVVRHPIDPVSAGDMLTLELELRNLTSQPKALLQARDVLPFVLGGTEEVAIASIQSQSTFHWTYYRFAETRGIYHWQNLELRTGVPLGLFWCRRRRSLPTTAVVYPTVLPLGRCPLVDEFGRDSSLRTDGDRRSLMASEGATRSLRPYRWGDPLRLVHWRTSARYGALRVRELETFLGSQDLVLCLDSGGKWELDAFEQAVTVAASLFFYSRRQGFKAALWTASTGIVQGDRRVLETLAAVATEETTQAALPQSPLVWLTQAATSCKELPPGSRWVLWPTPKRLNSQQISEAPGLVIDAAQPLQLQLQAQYSS